MHEAIAVRLQRWYSSSQTTTTPCVALHWWTTRNKTMFLHEDRAAASPKPILNSLWRGFTRVRGIRVTAAESLSDFLLTIRNLRASTSPGASELTHGTIKLWLSCLIELVYDHVASLRSRNSTPGWWLCRMLSPIPTVTRHLFPLMLAEVLRKL